MPLPRVRFTIRRMMLAVAVTAILLTVPGKLFWLWVGLSHRYIGRASGHGFAAHCYREGILLPPKGQSGPPNLRRAAYHEALEAKYRCAASFPFLPVAPDPPEPE